MNPCIVIPVYNEKEKLRDIVNQCKEFGDVVVVDDGSCASCSKIIASLGGICKIRHCSNRGYGAALISGFSYATAQDYDVVITIDADGQHFPRRIPQFLNLVQVADCVSGTRYDANSPVLSRAPEDRKNINQIITQVINQITGFSITDAFCGYKAYRGEILKKLKLQEYGYNFPLEVWIKLWKINAKVVELPVELFYPEEKKFPEEIEDSNKRLIYYLRTIEQYTNKKLDELYTFAQSQIN